jgi:glycosyltransferase involved in cell wall biosynthesis
MRIALVFAGPYPDLRGSQVLLRQIAEGVASRGHEVRLVTYGDVGPIPSGPWPGRLARDVALAARLWRTIREDGIDVIHAHNYEAAIAGLVVGRLAGRPVVYHGHNALADELPSYFRGALARRLAARIGRLVDAEVPRRADFCIAVSEALGDILRRRGVAEDGLVWIPPTPAPRDAGAPPARDPSNRRVCYAGNLDGYQNLRFLLGSFARVRERVPGARLVLATHAAPDRRLGGDGVEVVRAASYDEVRALLDGADVAVCPRAERSGFPMKLLNYMAAGKAIVACAGSAKGLRDGVTARIVPDGDEAAFATAIAELLEDAPARSRLGGAARRAVEDGAAWEDVLDRIEAIYRLVVARRAAGARLPLVTEPNRGG